MKYLIALYDIIKYVWLQVRHFLESSLVDLRGMWMKRLAYQMCFACPCARVCAVHETEACLSEECLHFLDLDECLTSQVREIWFGTTCHQL